MKYCPNCGATLEDHASFCSSCGTPQSFFKSSSSQHVQTGKKVLGSFGFALSLIGLLISVLCLFLSLLVLSGNRTDIQTLIIAIVYLILSSVTFSGLGIIFSNIARRGGFNNTMTACGTAFGIISFFLFILSIVLIMIL